jgi:hypothetical protein
MASKQRRMNVTAAYSEVDPQSPHICVHRKRKTAGSPFRIQGSSRHLKGKRRPYVLLCWCILLLFLLLYSIFVYLLLYFCHVSVISDTVFKPAH